MNNKFISLFKLLIKECKKQDIVGLNEHVGNYYIEFKIREIIPKEFVTEFPEIWKKDSNIILKNLKNNLSEKTKKEIIKNINKILDKNNEKFI